MFNNNSSVSTMMTTTTSSTTSTTTTRKPPVGKPILSNTSLAYTNVEESIDTRTPPSLVCNSPSSVFHHHGGAKRQPHREALANITNSHEVQHTSSTNDLNKRVAQANNYSNLKVNTHSSSTFTTLSTASTNTQCSKSFLNPYSSANGKTNAAAVAVSVHSMIHSNSASNNTQQFNTSSQHHTQQYTEDQQTFEQQVESSSSPLSSEQDPNAFNEFSMEASDENYSSDEEMDESEDDGEQQAPPIDPDIFNSVDKNRLQAIMDLNIRNPANLLPKSSLRTLTQTHLPIDVEDDILSYLFNNQSYKQVSPHVWRTTQKNVNAKMRTMLVEWIAGVAVSFKLLPETLYLSIDILDRFLCKVCVSNVKLLQGYGLACLFIAAKYCETAPPPLRQFLFAADNTYTRGLILSLESEICNALDFELCSIQSFDFVEKFLELIGHVNNARIKCLAYYICELQLQNFDALQYNKSGIALSSVIIALYVTGTACTLEGLVACLGGNTDLANITYINNCVMAVYCYYVQMSMGEIQHNFIKDKYARQSFGGVSTIGFTSRISPSISF
ncbi:cyclin A [Naegleria gruberi]|uniref:Cyclin A n=1 Tax=Naegleria gruberi TaxID=5762 RepID=D2VZL5_NAEGR|nr:cyclin A [Naegleria gruberi]EFC37678.1 cyclin A [Naegleria gruberi]|eukprot:XP_002670422.1 cyclin A [Naegleria gruberi]